MKRYANPRLRGEQGRRELGWSPSTTLADLVTMMVEADDRRVRENRLLY